MRVMQTTFFDPRVLEAAERLDSGIDLMLKNRFVEAIAEFEEVLKFDPTNYSARWDRCWALLSLGDYTNAMPDHDSAWQRPFDCGLTLPVWKGERCRLICYEDMGFGDAIMALRFLPELVRRCESVTIVVKPELVRMMLGHGVHVVDCNPEDVSKFDARISLFNSIHTMGYSRETIPSQPYIKENFQFSGGKMGIAWTGTTRKELDLTSFLLRLDIDDFDLYALQKGDVDYIPAFDRNIVPLRCCDFKETAELMATMDCIVTVDTAVANLAGAMGHPNAHVVMPYFRDWRWWNKHVWYPTINIYPQDSAGDWDVPFKRVNEAIHGTC